MFELGTTGHWWEIAKKYPILSNHPNTLKPLGYAHMINLIETFKPKRILEIGHGGFSFVFEIFYGKIEMWGLDDYLDDSTVSKEDLIRIRKEYPGVKFVEGLLGNNVKELPDNYFDLVYSVSVIEHVPIDALGKFFEETKRVTKPGGIVSHSYDVYCNQNTRYLYNAFENAGFEWMKSKDTMNVFWEEWLCSIDDENLKTLFKNIVSENLMQVAEVYMWEQERNKRHAPVNYFTILTAAKKPLEHLGSNDATEKKDPEQNLINPGQFSNFIYSKKKHFEIFNENNYSKELLGKEADLFNCDVKLYQNLLVYTVVKQNLKKGARVLEIGKSNLKILDFLKKDYECWNINLNKNSDQQNTEEQIKIVNDHIGNFNKKLPDNYFDFVFSISTISEEQGNDPELYKNILTDINRVLKPGAYSLQCFLVLLKNAAVFMPDIMTCFLENQKMVNEFVSFSGILFDPELFTMSEKFYKTNWQKATGRSFSDFGKPFSFNLLWKKM